jgi:hypothetical protein
MNHLNRSRLVDLTTYAGSAKTGFGVPDASAELDGSVERLRNLHVTACGRDPRVLYVSGWTRIVARRPQVVSSVLRIEGLVCLFVGKPNRVKLLDTPIDAIHLLEHRNTTAHLIVIGSSADLPGYVEHAQGMSNVHIVGELLDERILAPDFAPADVMLIFGAAGLSVNRAFAYGVPLVRSVDAPHGPEMAVAELGKNALLVRPMDAQSCAEPLGGSAAHPTTVEALKTGANSTAVPGVDDMVAAIETSSV